MKAMVLKATDEVAPEDIRRPESEDGGTLVRVGHSGVCGTDSKIFHGAIPVRHPLVMGHEMVARRSREAAPGRA